MLCKGGHKSGNKTTMLILHHIHSAGLKTKVQEKNIFIRQERNNQIFGFGTWDTYSVFS